MNYKHRLWYVVLVAIIVLVSCTYRVTINPNITPTANIANQLKLKVGLFIPESTRNFIISDRVQAQAAINADRYIFYAGKALTSIITKSTRRVFTSVEILNSSPTRQMIAESNFNLVAIARVTSGQVSLSRSSGFFSEDAEGNTSLSIQLTFYDQEMRQFTTIGVSGMGSTAEGLGFGQGRKEFSASVETAIRNLGDELVYQIYGNYDIRRIAEEQ